MIVITQAGTQTAIKQKTKNKNNKAKKYIAILLHPRFNCTNMYYIDVPYTYTSFKLTNKLPIPERTKFVIRVYYIRISEMYFVYVVSLLASLHPKKRRKRKKNRARNKQIKIPRKECYNKEGEKRRICSTYYTRCKNTRRNVWEKKKKKKKKKRSCVPKAHLFADRRVFIRVKMVKGKMESELDGLEQLPFCPLL